MKKIYCYFIISLLIQVNVFGQSFWEQTNGPYGGSITTFAVNSQGHIFAGTHYGLFRSTNNGESWIETGQRREIEKIRIDPNDQIYVRNGDKCSFSTDNGENWVEINNSFLSSNVYAINSSNYIFMAYSSSIFRSSNNGENWTELKISGITNIISLAINSNNQIFAGGYSTYFSSPVVQTPKIFCSSDNGETWSDVSEGLGGEKVSALLINSNNHIYAGSDIGGGLFSSTDNGENWTKINSVEALTVFSLVGISNNIILAGTNNGVFRSTDNGENWADCADSLPYYCNSLTKSGVNIFVGTFKGMFRSTDYGTSWIEVNNGLTNDYISTLASRPGNQIFAGSGFGQITRSSDNGETWKKIGVVPADNYPSISLNTNNHIFVNTFNKGIFRSTDDGKSWVKLNLSINYLAHLAFSSKNKIFANNGEGIYRSTNNGDNWVKLNFESDITEIKAIAINSQDYIFVGGIESNTYPNIGKVYRSTDDGESWTDVSDGLSVADFRFLEVSPNNNIYAATVSVNIPGDRSENVFCSTDLGETWSKIYNSEHDIKINSLAFNRNNQIFIAVWDTKDYLSLKGKVFHSNDNGGNWVEISNGLPGAKIISLTVDSSGYIFAGTEGASVYRSTNSTTRVTNENNNIPSTFSLSQNYPNPFNPTTKIEYSIPKESFVTLKIYDVLGREVATLVNEEKSTGKYEVEFNGNNLPAGRQGLSSGIYFYKLNAGDYSSVKKMILIK